MKIRFEQPYVPEGHEDTIRRLWRHVEWVATPALGDFVLLGDGPLASRVDRIFWESDGRALVHLHGNPKDGPTLSDAHLRSLAGSGWAPEERVDHESASLDEAGEESFPASDASARY